MSELRRVEIPADITLAEEVARKLGISTSKEGVIRGYSTANLKPDLILKIPESMNDFGIVNGRFVWDEDTRNPQLTTKQSSVIQKFLRHYVQEYVLRRVPNANVVETEKYLTFVIRSS